MSGHYQWLKNLRAGVRKSSIAIDESVDWEAHDYQQQCARKHKGIQ